MFGSACVDLLMQPDRLPRPGVTVLAPTYELLPGGKGANQAHACAMACENKTSVHFVGAVGNDAFGDSLRAAFLDANVGVSGLVTHSTLPTACAAVHAPRRSRTTPSTPPSRSNTTPRSLNLYSEGAHSPTFESNLNMMAELEAELSLLLEEDMDAAVSTLLGGHVGGPPSLGVGGEGAFAGSTIAKTMTPPGISRARARPRAPRRAAWGRRSASSRFIA